MLKPVALSAVIIIYVLFSLNFSYESSEDATYLLGKHIIVRTCYGHQV